METRSRYNNNINSGTNDKVHDIAALEQIFSQKTPGDDRHLCVPILAGLCKTVILEAAQEKTHLQGICMVPHLPSTHQPSHWNGRSQPYCQKVKKGYPAKVRQVLSSKSLNLFCAKMAEKFVARTLTSTGLSTFLGEFWAARNALKGISRG